MNVFRLFSYLQLSKTRRLLKYLLLLLIYDVDNKLDSEKLLTRLDKLNKKLSAFNSAKEKEVEVQFKSFDDSFISKCRNITLITKGAHNKESVLEEIEMLFSIMIDDEIKL